MQNVAGNMDDETAAERMVSVMRVERVIVRAIVVVLLLTVPALGLTHIADIARPWGERVNKLHGQGLVVGLNGSGDSDLSIMTRPLRVYLQNLGNPTNLDELKGVKNVALVQVTAEIGRNGAREGDQIDVYVSSIGNAKDLTGGMLLMAFLQSSNPQDDRVYAVAQGPVSIVNAANRRVGIVRGGADMEADWLHSYVHHDKAGRASFTLVIDENQASFQTARHIGMIIADELSPPGSTLVDDTDIGLLYETMVYARDARSIVVRIPPTRVADAATFIAQVMNMPIEVPEPEATVVINERAGTITFTGNVEIAPVSVSVQGLLIRIVKPEPTPSPTQPMVTETQWARFDTEGGDGAKIQQLTDALDQLKVPVQAQIDAILDINRAGALRARLITE